MYHHGRGSYNQANTSYIPSRQNEDDKIYKLELHNVNEQRGKIENIEHVFIGHNCPVYTDIYNKQKCQICVEI